MLNGINSVNSRPLSFGTFALKNKENIPGAKKVVCKVTDLFKEKDGFFITNWDDKNSVMNVTGRSLYLEEGAIKLIEERFGGKVEVFPDIHNKKLPDQIKSFGKDIDTLIGLEKTRNKKWIKFLYKWFRKYKEL